MIFMQNERPRSKAMNQETAREVAIEALSFLAGEPEELDRFLQLSGLSPDRLREAAREPGFLVGVLDYVLGGDRSLEAFQAARGVSPETVAAARMSLQPHDDPSAP